MRRFTGNGRGKTVLTLASAAAVAALVPTFAAGQAPPDPTVTTINMKGGSGGLRFDGPATAVNGSQLEIVNKTNPQQVGPHTFSLVTKGSLPKTRKARKRCFAPNHICRAIAGWHKVGKIKVSEVGLEGWDTPGSLNKKGDSWFSGNKAGGSFGQQLSFDTSAGPVRAFYLCAIHPEMKGSINVLPPPVP